jgi:hypothetical protein
MKTMSTWLLVVKRRETTKTRITIAILLHPTLSSESNLKPRHSFANVQPAPRALTQFVDSTDTLELLTQGMVGSWTRATLDMLVRFVLPTKKRVKMVVTGDMSSSRWKRCWLMYRLVIQVVS